MVRSALIRLWPLAMLLAVGCDYVSEPVVPGNTGGPPPDGTVRRRVLLEDFTGHRCNNCPAAHLVAAQLEAAYGADVVVVSVHATNTFAAPLNPPAADGRYSSDYRTPAGTTYAQTFGVTFLPIGMVSRRPYNGSTTVSPSAWPSATSELVGQPASMDVWFSSLVHDAGANTVSCQVKVAVLEPITGDHKLTVYLTEDHVIDWQLNAQATPPDIPDYDHRHVLRTNLNGTWGDNLIAGSASVGDTLTLNISNVAMNAAWNAANCALVAYVYDAATNEVMQAVERKFQP